MNIDNLEVLALEELNENELIKVEGGVSLLMWIMCPGGAYVLSKFEEGYGREIF